MYQMAVYPTPHNTPICETIISVPNVPTMPPSTSWQQEHIVARY